MYFELSQEANKDYTKHFDIKNYCLSTDLGWTEIQGSYGKIIYKGYAYTDLIQFLKTHDPETTVILRGSFTAIMEKNNRIHIVHDCNREYPIFINRTNNIVTNLKRYDDIVWPDTSVYIDCNDNSINTLYNGSSFPQNKEKSLDDTSTKILQILNDDINYFKSNYKNPIKVVPTGGIDSTLLIALLKHNNTDVEVIDYEHKKWTYFYMKNKHAISKNIGNMIFTKVGHTWGEIPITLANGWRGDQYFFREYLPLAVFCKIKNINLVNELKNFQNSYAYDFIQDEIKNRKLQLTEITKDITDKNSGYKKIFEIIKGSFQCWTFEQTCYWSPFKNTEITKSILQMNDHTIIKNALEVSVQRKILEKIAPNLLDIITNKKNEFDQSSYIKFTETLTKY